MAAAPAPFFRILYTGRASPDCEADMDGALADILAASAPRHKSLGVTGMLLAHRGWFIGCIEGLGPAVREAFAAMEADGPHLGLRVIAAGPLDARMFPGWNHCAWALSDDDAAVLAGFDEADDFDGSAVPEKTVLRLLAVVASAHGRRFAAQQRATVRRGPLER